MSNTFATSEVTDPEEWESTSIGTISILKSRPQAQTRDIEEIVRSLLGDAIMDVAEPDDPYTGDLWRERENEADGSPVVATFTSDDELQEFLDSDE